RVSDPQLVTICPTGALSEQEGMVVVDDARCVQCGWCRRESRATMNWEAGQAQVRVKAEGMPSAFRHSLHVRVVDAGDCGACLNEIHQLASPVYSLHRFGIAFTPTPREADVLLVVGPVTVSMRRSLEETYQAVADPKRVVAIGTCALSAGVFSSSFAVAGPVSDVIPVDALVPGCPPPPLAILQALQLVMAGSRTSGSLGEV
ncbi:MAG: hypothetical protein M0Z53_08180, partial [Thermaerobacter sp.]|nr:hypothetical protein [Thermaerobacter sp.]